MTKFKEFVFFYLIKNENKYNLQKSKAHLGQKLLLSTWVSTLCYEAPGVGLGVARDVIRDNCSE